MTPGPFLICGHNPCCTWGEAGAGSVCRMATNVSTDTRKDTASSSKARGATGTDHGVIGKIGGLGHYLTTWGWVAAGRAGSTQIAGLKKLRSLLRRMVDDLAAGRNLSAADLARLSAVMATAPAALQLVPGGGEYRLESAPIRQDCGWVFYDASRNRTRRWCEGGVRQFGQSQAFSGPGAASVEPRRNERQSRKNNPTHFSPDPKK